MLIHVYPGLDSPALVNIGIYPQGANFFCKLVSKGWDVNCPDDAERELVERARSGDRPAFTRLVQGSSGKIYSLAFRLCGNRADADDLAQEAFFQAYRTMGSFRQDCAFSSWVYRITVNLWKNSVRYEKRRLFSRHVSLDETGETGRGSREQLSVPVSGSDPAEQLEHESDCRAAARALETLNNKEKIIIVLSDIEQKSYNEIAELLQCPVGTVRSRLSRARESLRHAFEKITG